MCSRRPCRAGEPVLRVGTYVNERTRGPRLNHAITAAHNAENSIQGPTCAYHGCIGFRRVPWRESGGRQRDQRRRGPTGYPGRPTERVRDKTSICRLNIVGDIPVGGVVVDRSTANTSRARTFSYAQRCFEASRGRAHSSIHFCAQSVEPAATDLVRRNPVWRSRRRPCALVARRSG